MRVLGPGLITGASDDDPSGIATYSQAGAQFGFAISWIMLFTYPLIASIQQISARIGRTTGKGIAGNLRQHYPNWLLQGIVALLLVANTINIGGDLGAMADALRLLIGGPSLLYVIAFGSLCAILQVFMAYARYVAVLRWLTLALFTYFGTAMVVDIPWAEAARGFLIPTFLPDAAFWTTVVAVLGTTQAAKGQGLLCDADDRDHGWGCAQLFPGQPDQGALLERGDQRRGGSAGDGGHDAHDRESEGHGQISRA